MIISIKFKPIISTTTFQVQGILEDYRSAKGTARGAARRDSSRVITSNQTTASETSGDESTAAAAQSQQTLEQNSLSSQADVDNGQQRLKQLEELRNQNALLKLRLREEQGRVSSSTSDIKPSDINSLNGVNEQLQFSDSILGSFQNGGPSIPQSNNQIAQGQDPDILILPMVPAQLEEEEAVLDEPVGGILRSQPVQSFTARNRLLRDSSMLTPSQTQQRLLLEYRQLQERKRRIYQIFRQYGLAV